MITAKEAFEGTTIADVPKKVQNLLDLRVKGSIKRGQLQVEVPTSDIRVSTDFWGNVDSIIALLHKKGYSAKVIYKDTHFEQILIDWSKP